MSKVWPKTQKAPGGAQAQQDIDLQLEPRRGGAFSPKLPAQEADCPASEVCSVSGTIIATIGILTAIIGVFPSNQARIRLYLECLGCSMVIIGTLIIFYSHKMHTEHKRKNHRRRQFQWQLQFHNPPRASAQLLQPSYELVDVQDLAAPTELVQSGRGISKDHLRPELLSYETCGSDGAELNSDEEIQGADDDNDDIGRAAIEAALSIVLSVATMAGFRASSSIKRRLTASTLLVTCSSDAMGYCDTEPLEDDCCCCLHHAVNHKLSARRWIKRLERVRHLHHDVK